MIIIKTGDKFGRLTAIKFSHINRGQYWLFKCDCGNEKVICVDSVKRGNTKSCGCLSIEKATIHGMTGTKTYKSWQAMKQRCLSKKHPKYKNYGKRGIIICKEWMKFESFYKDMGDRPNGKTLDRIKNDKGYYKENCKWSTIDEQNNNKRNNVLLTYNSKTQTISQWAKKLNVNRSILYSRLNMKWSVEKTLTFNI